MAEIPVDSVVNVNIAVSPTFPARAGFGTLLIVTDQTDVVGLAERVREYSDANSVSTDWGANSEITAAATTYFSQNPRPSRLLIGVRFESDVAAQLRGGTINDAGLTALQAISDGSFSITIDGSQEDITSLDFTGVTTIAGLAPIIQAALRAVGSGGYTNSTCTAEGNLLIITSGTTGASSTLSWLSAAASGTDVSSLLRMAQGQGTRIDGITGETITESLTNIENVDSSWYGLAFTNEVRDTVIINSESAVSAAATWTEARTKVFFTTSNDENALLSTSTTDILSVLHASGLSRTLTVYSSRPEEYPAISVAGRALTVDFTPGNPSITLKFKQLPGITTEGLTVGQKAILDGKNANAYISIGGTAIFAEGFVAGGRFFDEVHGLDWLENAVQTEVFGALTSANTKILYTDDGVEILAQRIRGALDEAVAANLLAPGEDQNGNFLSRGYIVNTVLVADVSQSFVDARQYNGLSFTALGAGAIHGTVINGTFVR